MLGVFFRPWVGDRYEAGGQFSKRVLVLGESHYQWDENIPLAENLTIECVQEQLSGTATQAFWTKIAVAFLKRDPSLRDKREFWQAVAFDNYVQSNVGLGARVRPTEWEHCPSVGHHGPVIEGAPRPETWRYPVGNGGEALAYPTLHPSSGRFSGRYWHPFIMRAIDMA